MTIAGGFVGLIAFVAAGLLGCGSGGGTGATGPAGCGMVAPCGGDPTGTWKVIGSCFNAGVVSAAATAVCSGETVDIRSLSTTGSITFNSDMTYTGANVIQQGSESFSEPVGCLNGMTCAEESALLQTPVSTGSSCTGSETCVCSVSETSNYFGDSGDYLVYGTELHTTGTGNDVSFCVQGSEIHFITTFPVPGADGGVATVAGDVVAQRQ